jgi:hypothetical protein
MDFAMFNSETDELQGTVARVLNGSRSAAFNGGRSVSARDVCQDEVTLLSRKRSRREVLAGSRSTELCLLARGGALFLQRW